MDIEMSNFVTNMLESLDSFTGTFSETTAKESSKALVKSFGELLKKNPKSKDIDTKADLQNLIKQDESLRLTFEALKKAFTTNPTITIQGSEAGNIRFINQIFDETTTLLIDDTKVDGDIEFRTEITTPKKNQT